jgi:hypothetical protein
MQPQQPNYSPNVQNQTVEFGGARWKGNPGQGWTLDSTDQQQQQYQQQTDSAISGLQTQKGNLVSQYGDLLKTVTGEYQPLINQTTATAGGELAKRGLTPDSTLYQQQTQGALAPVYGQEATNAQQIGQGSINDQNTMAAQIANLQTGVAGTASQLPLSYQTLANQAALIPSQIFANQAQGSSSLQGANYVTIPNVGVYDIKGGSIISSTGLSNSGRTILGVNQ